MIAAVTGALLLIAAGANDTQHAAAPADARCDWATEFDSALADRGEQRADWTVTDLGDDQGGTVKLDQLHAYVNPAVPCRSVRSVVYHEWMHMQQGRMLGSKRAVYLTYGVDRVEVVADCGSMLLGATDTPYVDELDGGCTATDLADARVLIDFRPGLTRTHGEPTP